MIFVTAELSKDFPNRAYRCWNVAGLSAAPSRRKSMFRQLHKLIVAAGAAATLTVGAVAPRPASADTTSTIITAAAIVGAIILYNNYQHKRAAANQPIGYTRNGGVVYGDGRVVMPNGEVYYPDSYGDYNYNVAEDGYHRYHHEGEYHRGWHHHEHEGGDHEDD
jgi:hypothetical protein